MTCLLLFAFLSQRPSYSRQRNPVRPDGFPEVLIAPENAELVDYSSPSNSRRACGTYGLSFSAKDRYPADNMRDFIAGNLKTHKWRKLNFTILYPTAKPSWDVDKIKTPGMEVHTWQEEWINSKDETIHILLEYAFPADGPKDFNNLYVNITLFGKDSWKQVFIPQYKKLHPDEFEGPAPTLKK